MGESYVGRVALGVLTMDEMIYGELLHLSEQVMQLQALCTALVFVAWCAFGMHVLRRFTRWHGGTTYGGTAVGRD